MSQARPLGVWTAVLCGFGIWHVASVLVFVSTSTRWFQGMLGNDLLWVRLTIAWVTSQAMLALLSAGVLQGAARMPRGARGRARIVALSLTTGLHVLATTVRHQRPKRNTDSCRPSRSRAGRPNTLARSEQGLR